VISFEELSQKYPIQNVAPYGACVVVPGAEFDPDWEVALGDQGYRCIMTDLDMRPVTLVQRKDARSNESKDEKLVYAPKEDGGEKSMESKENRKSKELKPQRNNVKPKKEIVYWSKKDEDRLLKRMAKVRGTLDEKVKQLMPEFPGRTDLSLLLKWRKLKRAEKAKSQKSAKIAGPFFSKVEEVEEKPILSDYLPFVELWSNAAQLGTDLKQRAEAFYAAAVKAGWPVDLVESVISLCVELDGLRDYYDNNLAGKGEVNAVVKKLVTHKHAVSGEAMLPMEASK